MFNPEIKLAKSRGIDLPILYVYLAGRIAGNCMDKCTAWRKEIREHYRNYEFDHEYDQYVSFPISFLDPLNSGETKTADAQGLTSHLPANLIYDKDLLSVQRADVIVANVEDYFEEGIEEELYLNSTHEEEHTIRNAYYHLQQKILNRRENFGTICEFAIALYLQKPIILIVPTARKEIYEKHPFAKRASVIVTSAKQLIEEKWLQNLYKSISGAIYE